MKSLRLIRRSFPADPALGTAVSRAILDRVARGELPATMRMHRPGPELAFGRQDVAAPGYREAVRAAREAGFAAVERLAGGRAAVFHEGTLALARAYPDANPARRTYDRFEEMAELIVAALRRLGVEAEIGEVPGEYCPGAYSINVRGAVKLAGIGQRMIAGAAHVGGVLVVSGSERLRAVLEPVYRALELEWEPATASSVADEVGQTSLDDAEAAILAELRLRYEVVEVDLDEETLAVAGRLQGDYASPG